MHRGRLIFPIYVTIRRFDPVATEAAGGYDPIAGETKLLPSTDGLGTNARVDYTDIEVPCQAEEKSFFEDLSQMMQGNAPKSEMHLTFHINDLKSLGYWQETAEWGGRCTFAVGDRIIGLRDRWNQQLFKVPENPGLFIQELLPTGFLGTQNLIVAKLSDRSKGAV
jgi:hypothetical protein